MKAAEALFRSVYVMLVGVGYLRFLVLLLPVLAAAFALGFFNGTAVIGRRRGGRGVGLPGFRQAFGLGWTARPSCETLRPWPW